MAKTIQKKPVNQKVPSKIKGKSINSRTQRSGSRSQRERQKSEKPSQDSKKVQMIVVDVEGKPAGKISIPKELIARKINRVLLAQAVRVYLANQREGSASTKTRGQVAGSTRKIYRQKGTGRARHGGVRAPIFVGGGVVFGPKRRDYHLKLPKRLKRLALASALSQKHAEKSIMVVDGIEKLPGKTKLLAKTLSQIGAGHNTLLLVSKGQVAISRAARNLASVDVIPAIQAHPYAILSHRKIVFMKPAISELSTVFTH